METKSFGWLLMAIGAVLCIVAIVKFAIVGFYPSIVSDWIGYAIAGAGGVACVNFGIRLIDDK